MFTEFFTKNLDVVFFVYGLAFVIMGIAIFIQPRRESIFKISDIIWILGAFGLSHGLNEWVDMFTIIRGPSPTAWLIIGLAILFLSYIFLFEFGRRLMLLSFKNFLSKWITISLCFVIFVLIVMFKKEQGIWPRYLLGFPGGLMTAFGLFFYYRNNKSALRPINVHRYFLMATFFVGIYGILGGVITPKSDFFPASLINNDSFLAVVGIPVQVFRAICAVFLAWSVWHILSIFNWEITQGEKEAAVAKVVAEAERRRAEEIEKVYKDLEKSHLELKQAQHQLVQTEKFKVIGRLASGVAHEVKNPLATIVQGVEYLKKEVRSDDENISLTLRYIEDAIYRADGVIRGLLDFSSLSKLDMKPQDLNSFINDSLLLMKYQFDKYHIRVNRDFEENMPSVRMDRNKAEQVFVNLILNAVQAMPGGGELRIKTHTLQQRDEEKWAVVQVEDTGTGIPGDILEKIFDPFFTTKRDIGGTGLGLWVVRNIIDMHGGRIEIENKKDNHGVRVTVMFKYKTKEVDDMEKKRILIIDDEEAFTKMVKLNLEATGIYEVRIENKGALGLSAAKTSNPDLILLDIIMPDMEGSDVASQLTQDDSTKDIPIVFLTAAVTKKETDASGGVIGGHPFVAKPVRLEELIDCIEKNIIK